MRALLTKTGPGKLSAQLRMGYAYALDQGYEGVVTIDGNGKDSVEAIPLFVEALDEGIDYAQASRFVTGGRAVKHAPPAHPRHQAFARAGAEPGRAPALHRHHAGLSRL